MKLIIDHVSYQYNNESEEYALKDISLVINKGEFIGLIGHTGSGKSTLTQVMNGLIKPSSGTVYFEGADIFDADYDRRMLRGKVGLVFQYPEHQLFEDTCFKDVCFGPKNMGVSRKDAELRAYEALKKVNFPDDYFYQSPLILSGGLKRRVAIAGVLAMHPEVLILDEPAAGLDPVSKRELLELLKQLQKEKDTTIIMVSHSMDDVAEYADRVVVIDEGRLAYDDTPGNVFAHQKELEVMGLGVPEIMTIVSKLVDNGIGISHDIYKMNEAKEAIITAYYEHAKRG